MRTIEDQGEARRLVLSVIDGADPGDNWHGKLMDNGEWYVIRMKAGKPEVWHADNHEEAMIKFRELDLVLQRLIDAKNAIARRRRYGN